MRLSYGGKNGPGSFRKRPNHSHRSKTASLPSAIIQVRCSLPATQHWKARKCSRLQHLFPLPIFLLSLYLPVFPIFFLARHYYQKNAENTNNIWISTNNSKAVSNLTVMPKTFSLDDHLMSCLETMEKIGFYIMLFSILSLYLFKLPLPGPDLLNRLLWDF